MKIFIAKPDEFDHAAAIEIISQVREKPDSVLGVATGATTAGVYKELVKMSRNGFVDFSKVVVFGLDEYAGIPATHKMSCSARMFKQLLDHIPISMDNIHLLDGRQPHLGDECKKYEAEISSQGGIDLQLVGIGLDGHIGFNGPGTSFASVTHVTDVPQAIADAKPELFYPDTVPRNGITMGIKTIMAARKILLLAKGKDKAAIVHRALHGPVTEDIPASVLQRHRNLSVILDGEAAGNT